MKLTEAEKLTKMVQAYKLLPAPVGAYERALKALLGMMIRERAYLLNDEHLISELGDDD